MPAAKPYDRRSTDRNTPRAERDFLWPDEFRELYEIGEDTWYRWQREGHGPRITRLSPRKIIILNVDIEEWKQGGRQAKRRKRKPSGGKNGDQRTAA